MDLAIDMTVNMIVNIMCGLIHRHDNRYVREHDILQDSNDEVDCICI